MVNSTNPVVHLALTRLAPLVLSRPAVQGKAARKLGQIAASYRDCPISKGGGSIGVLHAGDRVPDVRVGNDRLYDLLEPSTLTLFTSGAGRIAEAHRPWDGAIALRKVALPDEVVAGPGWLLVRPDGYLAAAGSVSDAPRLTAWLDRWLMPTA